MAKQVRNGCSIKQAFFFCPSLQDDEYVIYNCNQQRMQYLVEFSLPGDKVQDVTLMSQISQNTVEQQVETSAVSEWNQHLTISQTAGSPIVP